MTLRATCIAAGLALGFSATTAAAADECTSLDIEDFFDLEDDAVVTLFGCLIDKMATGYAKDGDATGAAFRDWAATSTRPAVAGPHGNRLLNTFANDAAAEQYLKFEDEGVVMPTATEIEGLRGAGSA